VVSTNFFRMIKFRTPYQPYGRRTYGMRVTVLVVFVLSSAVCFAADKNIGTWKLNSLKSKGVSGLSRTMKVAKAGPNTFEYIFEDTRNGKTTRSTDNRICDGKEHRSSGTIPSRYVCDDSKTVFMRDDKSKVEYKHAYSADGKTLTNSVNEWNADGKLIREEVRVFDRQ
jgi:hypothetical protein